MPALINRNQPRGAEIVAELFLTRNFEEPVYEPDGNIPPDFWLPSLNVAIEVRQLEQMNGKKGWNVFTDAMQRNIEKALRDFAQTGENITYWIIPEYNPRQVVPWKKDEQDIRNAIALFLELRKTSSIELPCELDVNQDIHLYIDFGSPTGQLFRINPINSGQEFYQNIATYLEAIQFCINEKSHKIMKNSKKYASWWLCLVDGIEFWHNPDDNEINDTIARISNLEIFEKVIIISGNGERLLASISK